jgi:hypothetical protein
MEMQNIETMRPALALKYQQAFSECSPQIAAQLPASCKCKVAGRPVAINTEHARDDVCDTILSATKSEDPLMCSGDSLTLILLDAFGEADPPTMEIDYQQADVLFESLESPRADADDRQAWLHQRQYRALQGARNLHID